jgi:hypothetical protein
MTLILAVVCGFWILGLPGIGETPSPAKKDSPVPAKLLSPKVEAKLKDFLAKEKDQTIKSAEPTSTRQIEDVVSATSLGDDGKKALEMGARQAVAAWADDWVVQTGDNIRKEFAAIPPDQASKILDQRMNQVFAFSQFDYSGEIQPPFERDEWTRALQQTLTPDQMAAWEKAQADHKAAVEKEIGDSLKQGVDRIRIQQTQGILVACKEIELAVGLPKDRSDKLEALGKSVADQTTEMWRKRIEKMVLAMDETQRHQFALGRFFMGTDEKEAPVRQSAWKDGVASLLTADETARLQAERDARKSKREMVLGEVMLMELDEKLALTEAQRQKLQPIANRLVKEIPQLFPDDTGGNPYYGYSPDVFLSGTAKATDAELKPVLDDIQLKRWRNLAMPDNSLADSSTDDKSKPEKYTEPEDVERAISSFLYEKSENERKRVVETNLLQAEDVVRVAGLKPQAAERMEAAALGATESYLSNWKWFTEQQIRSQLQDVTPQNVMQRLESIQDFFFQRSYGPGNHSGFLDETVKTMLDPKEQEAWKKETDERKAFQDKAVAAFVLAEFDRENRLTPQQWDKLEPVIAGIVQDYSPEIGQIFAFNNGVPWYMEGSYLLMPFAGVSDTDLKAILTKDQVDAWHSSAECSNATSLWQNIQQNHDQRVKAH